MSPTRPDVAPATAARVLQLPSAVTRAEEVGLCRSCRFSTRRCSHPLYLPGSLGGETPLSAFLREHASAEQTLAMQCCDLSPAALPASRLASPRLLGFSTNANSSSGQTRRLAAGTLSVGAGSMTSGSGGDIGGVDKRDSELTSRIEAIGACLAACRLLRSAMGDESLKGRLQQDDQDMV